MNLNCITGNQDHLYKRIKQSLHNAKSVDIIVSFLMESGVKLIQKDLEEIANKNIPIRILTGNYLNITQPSALYLIKDILGDKVDLRFYSDTKRSFHPKAYIFEFEKGGEIFIGSSNLSKSALTSGIEWNYRIDKDKNIEDYTYFKNMFEELFYNESIIVNDQELEKYSKTWKRPKVYSNVGIDEFNKEPKEEKNVISIFEPRGAQIEALYELRKTREEGNDKGLIVAATGIGKTYLAAFDSREFNKVLFVAHREEILKQACETFKTIRLDKKIEDEFNMGFFMNSTKDTDKDIIFASVQSLGKESYLNDKYFEKDYFDYIVLDEVHHAVSKNYQNIINYFTPKFILGLTATPNRLDNKDVFSIFDYNTVYEATLKNAIDKGWLVPFRYYGIYDDSVDYEEIKFDKGKYNTKELEEALSINKRADLVLNHYKKYKSSRALGFCTSKSHAEFMAKYFNEQGISSCAVYSGADGEFNEDRSIALRKLRDEDIQVIFSVDMFNEGLDVKSIDMVMFLRPTESPTIFLQQLGRGLRKDKNKKYLNVLDFIGNYKKANLAPCLLKGESKLKEISGKYIAKDIMEDENYPEDCFVDFDFRIVDIFERMRKANQKIEDRIKETYFSIKSDLGYRPSRVDMFTYMDDDLYDSMKSNSKVNIFRNYMKFLLDMNELNEEEEIFINTFGHEFINMVEITSMNKTLKLPILLAFYNKGDVKEVINTIDMYDTFIDFYSKGSNKVDLIRHKETKDFEVWSKEKVIKYLYKNPVNFLCKSSSKFFSKTDEEMYLNNELHSFLSEDLFVENFKDAIDFRNKEFYKNRIKDIDVKKEDKKNDYDKLEYVLRDEKINVFASTVGNTFSKNKYEVILCKTKDMKKVPYLLDCKRSSTNYKLSEIGKEYLSSIESLEPDLKYVAYVESQIKIKVDEVIFKKLSELGYFSIWESEAPVKYYRGNEEGYVILLRVYELNSSVDETLLEKGRRGANPFFKLSEAIDLDIKKPILSDKEYNSIKSEIISTIKNLGCFIDID